MEEQNTFVASDESKGKAKQFRVIAFILWIIAIGIEIYAILKLISNETMVALIIAIVVILACAVTASFLWKKANRLDPASEKDKTRFFIQNQLGAIMGVLAFLPLVILIFTNKDLDGKTKGIAGSIAVVAMLIAGISGADFNPPSVEKYTEEIKQQNETLKDLNVTDDVHWSKAGNKYHIYRECQHIKNKSNITEGTISQSFEQRGISELCKTCQNKAKKVSVLPESN